MFLICRIDQRNFVERLVCRRRRDEVRVSCGHELVDDDAGAASSPRTMSLLLLPADWPLLPATRHSQITDRQRPSPKCFSNRNSLPGIVRSIRDYGCESVLRSEVPIALLSRHFHLRYCLCRGKKFFAGRLSAAPMLRNLICSGTEFGMKRGRGNVRPFITGNADGLQKGLFLLQLI